MAEWNQRIYRILARNSADKLIRAGVVIVPAINEVPMSGIASSPGDKKGDAYDSRFIAHMIEHHEATVAMAKLSDQNAKHDEIKQLSRESSWCSKKRSSRCGSSSSDGATRVTIRADIR